MRHYIYELSACISAVVGIAILWANPKRSVNLASGANALLMAAWALLTQLGINQTIRSDAAAWLRIQAAVGGFSTVSLLLVSDIICSYPILTVQWLKRRWPVIVAAVGLVGIPLTNSYMPYTSPYDMWTEWGHLVFVLLGIATTLFILVDIVHRIKEQVGLAKAELRAWLLTFCIFHLLVYFLVFARSYTPLGSSNYVFDPVAAPTLVMAIGFAFLIIRHKIFDANYIILRATKHGVFLLILAVASFFAWRLAKVYNLGIWSFCLLSAVIFWGGSASKVLLDRWFEPKRFQIAHRAVVDLVKQAGRKDVFTANLTEILRRWAETGQAGIWIVSNAAATSSETELSSEDPAAVSLRELRWATPGRLTREHREGENRALIEFMTRNHLGAVVLSEGSSLAIIIGLGVRPTGKVYSFGLLKQLQEMAALVTATVERMVATEQASKAARLATIGFMGASVAHEIRNPVLAIKTFAELLPEHYDDSEFRQRFFKVIKDEAGRIDELTGQLLALSAPSRPANWTDVHPAIDSCIESIQPRAQQLEVTCLRDFKANPSVVWANPSVIKQVMLNLLINALHAMEQVAGDRCVKISTRNTSQKIEVVVQDTGPGIAADIWPKLFEPFQTTKSRGFGLGLATSRNLLNAASATLRADHPVAGSGAIFRIQFPVEVAAPAL